MSAPVPLPDDVLKELIIARVGDTSTGSLRANIDVIWLLYAYLPLSYPGGLGLQLQALYAQRDCLEIAMSGVRGLVDTKTGVNERKGSQSGARLESMLGAITAEITRIERILAASRGTFVGQLTQVVPEPNPFGPGTISADDTAFRGDPYTPYPGGVFGPPVVTTG